MGLPMPSIHLPKRKPKPESANTSKVTVASVEGTLRKLGEKDLLLQTSSNRVLKFRLIAKTEFLGKDSKPIRDSLLHPGDHLTIEANPDDPETAIHVILAHSGSKSERESASSPVEEASINAPTSEDLGKPHTTIARDSAGAGETTGSTETAPAGEAVPIGATGTSGATGATSDDTLRRIPSSGPPSNGTGAQVDDQLINDARDAAASFTSSLPNFVVEQATTRYQGAGFPAAWRAMDVVTADVASVDGNETYKNIKINGRPTSGPVEDTGSWSTGEFATTLQDVLSFSTSAVFKRRGEDQIAGRPAVVYDLTVQQPNSHWTLVSLDRRNQYSPAYKGSIWIDKETRRVLRIEQQTLTMPRDFSYDKAEAIVEYGFVNIDGKRYLLPVRGENMACMTGTRNCSRNVIEFRNYRKFGSESNITFDKQ
jgi:hypothetical protein